MLLSTGAMSIASGCCQRMEGAEPVIVENEEEETVDDSQKRQMRPADSVHKTENGNEGEERDDAPSAVAQRPRKSQGRYESTEYEE